MTRRLAMLLVALASCSRCSTIVDGGQASAAVDGNLVANPGFEELDGVAPRGWTFETRASQKGTASVARAHAHSGDSSLKLAPNDRNRPWDLANHPLSMGQAFPAGPFRGKTLHISGWLAAEGPAVAVAGLYALRSDGGVIAARLEQDSTKPGPVHHEATLLVPNDTKVQYIVVNCAVEGTQGAAFVDDLIVSLTAPPAAAPRAAIAASSPQAADITIDADHEIRRIPRSLYGSNIEWIWNGDGIWNPQSKGLDAELVRLTGDTGISLLRYPGGVFADFYHWRDGIGPQGSRRQTPHSPGGPQSANVFGTDEALAFAKATGSDLLITVNAGTGTAEEAADWVRYVSQGGRNSRVNYWEIGNELYVKDPRFVSITPDPYIRRVHDFARAMRQADSSIKIAAISDVNYSRSAQPAYPGWTDQVLQETYRDIDLLAVHNGYAPMLVADQGLDVRTVYGAMLAAPVLIKKSLESVAAKIDALGPDASRRVKIAVTEWGPFFHFDPQSRFVDHVKTLGSALYVASVLKVFVESPAVEVANAFKLVDPLFMGWIGFRDGHYAPTAPYFALQLYTRHFGERVVSSTTRSPTYDSAAVGWVDRLSDVPYLDVVSSRSADGKTLYVLATNKHFDSPIVGRIALRGFTPANTATAWVLNGTGIDANTGTRPAGGPGAHWAPQASADPGGRFDRGGPGEVTLTSVAVPNVSANFDYTFPAHSVTSLEFKSQ